jgi:hypothetical protein
MGTTLRGGRWFLLLLFLLLLLVVNYLSILLLFSLFVFFISLLFVVLCSLCLYVELLLLFTWLLTHHVHKQEWNWTELLCVLHLWQVLTLLSTVLYKYIKAHYLYISLFIYLLNILDFVGIHLWLIIKEFQMDMHGYMCYTFKSNFVTATNSKLILH